MCFYTYEGSSSFHFVFLYSPSSFHDASFYRSYYFFWRFSAVYLDLSFIVLLFFFFWYSIFKSFLFSLVSLKKKKKKIPKIIFQRVGGGEKIGFPEHGNFSNLDRNLGRWRGRKLDGLFPITFGIRVFDICPRKWLKLDPLK